MLCITKYVKFVNSMSSSDEIWKDVVGYEGLYKVSNLGSVVGLEREYLCHNNARRKVIGGKMYTAINGRGYYAVRLSKNGVRISATIHRLVAKAFISNPQHKPCINHKNGVKTDNRVENLEWCTAKENIIHSFEKLKRKAPKGAKHARSKPCIQRLLSGEIVNRFPNPYAASEATGIKMGNIWFAINKSKSGVSNGYIWS